MFTRRRLVYLDHNATTPVSYEVQRTIRNVLKRVWGNPSSSGYYGKLASGVVEEARNSVARALSAPAHELYFTGCATESNNAVLKSLSAIFYPEKKKIVSTPIEHPSVINTLEYLKSSGIEVEYCRVDRYGRVDLSDLSACLDDQTFLVCCMLANNENGVIQNLKRISALAKEKGILVFSDCVQALGKIPVNVKELGLDYASFSAHKLYGPKGIGALFARIGAPGIRFLHGGHQEEGFRAGTESVHNIAGFGTACRNMDRSTGEYAKVEILKKTMVNGMAAIFPQIVVNSPEEDCLPNTLSITLPGYNSHELMRMLDGYGICVSSGSACSSHLRQPSHVLKAIGLDDKAAMETLRISLGRETSRRDVDYFLKTLRILLKEHRSRG